METEIQTAGSSAEGGSGEGAGTSSGASGASSSPSGNVGETESLAQGQPVSAKGTLDRARAAIKSGKPAGPAPIVPAGQAAGEVTPPWAPNFKFRYRDAETEAKVEQEIDELYRPLIKDAETEAKVRELHEKAFGVEFLKPRIQKYQEKLKEVEGVNKNLLGGITELRETYSRGDFEGFFQKLGIPEEKVLQWVIDKAQYNQLPPEQKAMLDARKSAEQRAWDLEKQNRSISEDSQQQKLQAKQYLVTHEFSKPDVKSFVEKFDQVAGKPGKFFEAVRNYGDAVYKNSGGEVDLTPEQAVKAMMDHYSPFVAQQASAKAALPENARVIPREEAPAQSQPKVLPKVESRAAQSPTKAKPKSIADLNKLLKGMQG